MCFWYQTPQNSFFRSCHTIGFRICFYSWFSVAHLQPHILKIKNMSLPLHTVKQNLVPFLYFAELKLRYKLNRKIVKMSLVKKELISKQICSSVTVELQNGRTFCFRSEGECKDIRSCTTYLPPEYMLINVNHG
jgi:hypothetical protein